MKSKVIVTVIISLLVLIILALSAVIILQLESFGFFSSENETSGYSESTDIKTLDKDTETATKKETDTEESVDPEETPEDTETEEGSTDPDSTPSSSSVVIIVPWAPTDGVGSFASVVLNTGDEDDDDDDADENSCENSHTFADWTTIISASCIREGEMSRTCILCNYEETKTVETSGHNLVTIPGKAATCSETGLTDGEKCADCGEILSQQTSIAKTEHSFGGWSTATKATCQAEGKDTRSCIYCGKTESKTTEKTGHNAVTVVGRPATCSQTGLTDGSKCADCGKTLTKRESTGKLDHSYGDWSVTKEATCKAKGKETRKCVYCGNAETRSIEKTNKHNYSIGVCTVCGHVSEGSDCLKYRLSDDGTYYACIGMNTYFPPSQIIIPSTYNGKPVKEVGTSSVFNDICGGFEEIVIMEGIEKIHYATFQFSHDLKTVYLPSTLNYIGGNAFDSCESLDYVYISSTGWQRHYSFYGKHVEDVDLSDPHAAAVYLRKFSSGELKR